jgi:predicted unusual protein kinase regulating ubiquinone biosynthesis (AarF/ABC1/UbiB family)
MARKGGKLPETIFGRTSRMLLSGAKIASKEVATRLADVVGQVSEDGKLAARIKQTEELVKALSELKGAAMKAGQWFSIELSDVLPPEVTAVLRQLHDESTFMPLEQVETILAAELGPRRADLQELSPEPIAAASIGQVHRAVVKGRPVAVKVQYPGVANSIDTDLMALKRFLEIVLKARGKDINVDATFAELSDGLKKEADYELEASNLMRYRRAVKNPAFVVPEVLAEYSTKRLLVMSFEEGERIGEWLKKGPNAAEARRFGELILNLMLEEFYLNGIVQTDPNYGNFLYRPDRGQLVLLDFGATKAYSAAFRREVREIMAAAVDRDDVRLLELVRSLKLLDPRESAETQSLFLNLMRKIADLFAADTQPFDFGNADFLKELRALGFKFVQSVRYTTHAPQLLFLNRKLGGMYHMLKDVGFSEDLSVYFERALALEIAEPPE